MTNTPREQVDQHKQCSKCDVIRPISDFYPRADSGGKQRSHCKDCYLAYGRTPAGKASAAKTGKKRRFTLSNKVIKARYESKQYAHLKGGYSLDSTKEILMAIWTKQEGRCAVCLKQLELFNQETVIDHDHWVERNNARGFLCRKCNWGLGNFTDSPTVMLSAAEYIKAWRIEVAARA